MSANSGKCAHCNAALTHGQVRCVYCGGLTDVDLSGRHYYSTHQPEKPRICAGCGQEMKTINLQSQDKPFYIERCENCMGLFFDPGEIDAFIDDAVREVYSIDHLRLFGMLQEPRTEVVRYVKCPVCSNVMNRINFGKSSGVILDHCREHGLYLDAGELKRILQWARAGGHKRQQERESEAVDLESQKLRPMLFPTESMDRSDNDAGAFLKKLASFAMKLI